MEIVNIAAYKFVGIPDRETLRPLVLDRCVEWNLKGTILLADEGINFNVAGTQSAIDEFLNYLKNDAIFENRFNDLELKVSYSDKQPFRKMVVRMPKEIITMKHPMIKPEMERAASVEPKLLDKWLQQGHDDEGREIVIIDTRNDYEVEMGKFECAVDYKIEQFSSFPDAVRQALDEDPTLKNKTIVTYCTGGIRCEKAALFMNELDLPRVYQLQGGILNYFAEVGGKHWTGECFVFDERYALAPDLQPTKLVREA